MMPDAVPGYVVEWTQDNPPSVPFRAATPREEPGFEGTMRVARVADRQEPTDTIAVTAPETANVNGHRVTEGTWYLADWPTDASEIEVAFQVNGPWGLPSLGLQVNAVLVARSDEGVTLVKRSALTGPAGRATVTFPRADATRPWALVFARADVPAIRWRRARIGRVPPAAAARIPTNLIQEADFPR